MTGIKSRWFVEVFLDTGTVRFWNDFGNVVVGGDTFTGLGDRFAPPDKLKREANLKPETTKLLFDSSRALDDGDILADLLDAKWRRRQIRIRNIHYTSDPDTGDVISDTYGRIRRLSDQTAVGKAPRIEMEIESGSLIYLERRMQTRSAENQKVAFPADVGFDLTKRLEDVALIWRTKETKKGSATPSAPTTDDPSPRMLAIGEFVTEGTFVAHFTNQQQKKNWMRVFAIADCEITELNKVWINGQAMITSPLADGVRTAITALNSGGTRAWITLHKGAWNQTVDTFLDSVETQWTSNHRLRGVAYVVIEHLWDSDNPQSYDYKFGGKGAKFYDRRKDTTAGGSGTHRLLTPSTWEYSVNPMVIADHYRQGVRMMPSTEPLSEIYWFGVGEAADVMPYSEYEDLADLCEENVTLKAGGTHKRYEAHGMLSAADDHKENLERLALAMAARAIDQGGRIVFRPVRTQASIITLNDGDLINSATTQYDPAGRIDDMANTIEGRFYSKLNDYKSTDYPTVSNATYIDEDGDVISDTRNYDFEIDGERAQRLALLELAYSRRIAELREAFLSSTVRDLRPGDWFTRSSPLRGFGAGKLFEVDKITRSDKGTTEIIAVEVDPDQQAWDETTAVDLSVPPTIPSITIADLTVPSISVAAISYAHGGTTVPAFQFTHAAYADFIGDEIEVEYGVTSSGQSYFTKIPGDVNVIIALAGAPPSTSISVRFRARQGERFSAWSSYVTTTSTSVYAASTSGVADSIIGQGWGATANEASASNAQVGTGANSLVDTGFRQPGSDYWQIYDNSAGSLGFSVLDYDSGIRVGQAAGAGFTSGQYIVVHSASANTLSVKPGDTVGCRCLVGGASISSILVRIGWLNDAGAFVAYSSGTTRTTGILTGAGEADFFTEESVVAVAPANATRARFDVVGYANGASPHVRLAFPTMAILQTGQTVAPPLQRGFDAAPGSDVTGDNTASAIDGQGALATLNQATWATQITGTGKPEDFANVSRVFRSSTAPVGPNVNDLWVVLAGGVPIAVRAWDGSLWITGADLTALNTAAAIDGQGWGATASEASASNARVGTGANSLVDTGFRQPFGTYWQIYDNGAGSLGFSVLDYDSGIRVGQAVGAGFTAGQFIVVYAGVKNKLSVKPGDAVGFRCLVGGASLSSIRLRIVFQDDAGAVVSVPESTPRTTGILTGAGEADFFTEESLVAVAPALATRARVDVLGYVSGASPRVRLAFPTMAILQTGQTVAPPLQRGFDAVPGADPTIDNTAAAFTGQGALATLDQATWATQITGTGKPSDFANVSRVFRSSTAPVEPNLNDLWVVLAGGVPIAVRAWDGSSWITGADLTSLNTAAAIAGQGWGATAAEAAASNAQVAIGANAIGNSEFYAGVDGWSLTAQLGNTGALSLRSAGSSFATPYRGTLMVYQPDAGATGYTDIRWRPQRNGVTGFPLKVQPGDKVAMRANVSAHRCLIRSYIQWRDAAGLVLSYTVGPTNNAILSSSTEPDVWPLLSVVGTAPASAAWAEIMFRKEATSSGANSYMFLHKPMLALLAPGSVVVPQYAPGVPLDIYGGADVTGDNTAGSVVGQGALATLNQVGTSNLSASAVTDTAADSTDAAASLANNTWTTVATVSVTAASGADLLITGSAFHLASYSGAGSYTGSIACDLRLRRDSTVLRTQDATTNVLIAGGPGSILSTTRGPSTIQDVDLSVSAGTYSYTLQANIDLKQVGGSGLVRNISNRLLIVTQLKR